MSTTGTPDPHLTSPGPAVSLGLGASFAQHTWAWMLVRGIALLLLGLFSLFAPGFALFVFATVFAVYSFIDGVLGLLAGVRAARHDGRHWGSMVFYGVVGIAIGVLFVAFPLRSTMTYAVLVVWLVAAWAAVTGVLEISAAVRLRQEIAGEWLLALTGVLSLLLGVALVWLLFADPAATLLSVAWLIALYAFVSGIALIALAWRMRGRTAA